MKGVIDRIEEGIAVVQFDDGFMLEVPARYISGSKEGLVVEIRVDDRETRSRREDIAKLQADLLAGKHLKGKKKKS